MRRHSDPCLFPKQTAYRSPWPGVCYFNISYSRTDHTFVLWFPYPFQSRSKFQQSWHIVMFIVMAWNQTLGQYVKSGHYRCLPHPFQFFIQHLLAILRSIIWPTDSGNKGRETEIQGHRFELRVLRSVRMLVYLPAVQATCISPSAVMYISWPVCIALLYFVSSNFG